MDVNESLERRMRALERRQRRLVWCCVGLAIGLLASVLWRLVWVPREIVAQRFVLKDSGGGTRGRWGARDRLAAVIDGEQQRASATCFEMDAAKPTDGSLRMCTPWEAYGGTSLVMTERTGASLHVGVSEYTLSILGRTSSTKGNRGALVLGVWQDKPSIQVSDKDGRRTQLRPDGMVAYDAQRAIAYRTPGSER